MQTSERPQIPAWTQVAAYLLLTFGALWMLLPFFWMVTTSLKSLQESIAVPPSWIPKEFHFDNYPTAMSIAPSGSM